MNQFSTFRQSVLLALVAMFGAADVETVYAQASARPSAERRLPAIRAAKRQAPVAVAPRRDAVLSSRRGTSVAETPRAASNSTYRIGPADVLEIAVWENERLSRAVTVRPDGRISLPLVNDVMAAGMTPMELRAELIGRLAEYLPSPEVSVIVTEVRSMEISVIGEVKSPGRFELRSRATVLDALALAGGMTEFASKGRIAVLRSGSGRSQKLGFDYGAATGSDAARANFVLRPGDIIVVP